MTDKEYVRAHWEWVQVRLAEPFEGIAEGQWTLRLPLLPFSQFGFDSEAAAWSAAWEYTEAVLEQVRQLEAEISMVKRQLACQPNKREVMEYSAPDVRLSQVNVARWSRILARLESAMADLKRGMKPTP